MQITTRRTTLVSLGAAAAATLAAATLLRKPRPAVMTPVVAPGPATPALAPLAAVIAADPPAPPADVAFLDADGAPHHLSDFAGRAVVLNLWATWCVPCVAELPALEGLARRLAAAAKAGGPASGDIVVLPLSSDHGGAEVVRKFYAARGLTGLPIWLDPKGDAARAWGARGIPTTLLIDRQGRERARVEGPVDWAADASLARIRELVA